MYLLAKKQKMQKPDIVNNIFDTPLEHPTVSGDTLGLHAALREEARVANVLHADQLRAVIDNLDPTKDNVEWERRFIGQTAAAAERLATGGAIARGIEQELVSLKEDLASLPAHYKKGLHSIFEEAAPPLLRDRKNAWAKEEESRIKATVKVEDRQRPRKERHGWLLRKFDERWRVAESTTWTEWLTRGATDEELMNFAQWHTASVEAMQADPEITSFIHLQKQAYKKGYTRGIEEGYLHPSAKEFVGEVDSLPVIITDLHEGFSGGDIGGYARREQRTEIVNSNIHTQPWGAFLVEPVDEAEMDWIISEVLGHELNHLGGEYGPVWVNEALTEHIELVNKNRKNDWEKVSPLDRSDKGGYPSYRHLLSVVIGDSKELVRALTQAYSAMDTTDYLDARKQTDEKVRDLLEQQYGSRDVFEAIWEYIEEYAATLPHAGEEEFKHTNLFLAADHVVDTWGDKAKREEILGTYADRQSYRKTIVLDPSLDEHI